jgi:hypothetical protein
MTFVIFSCTEASNLSEKHSPIFEYKKSMTREEAKKYTLYGIFLSLQIFIFSILICRFFNKEISIW